MLLTRILFKKLSMAMMNGEDEELTKRQ